MATTTTPRPRISDPDTGARAYDAFVSYSHAADGRLAPALQRGLQSLAKPWYRRRALRVFRDETSLSASPELWSAIEDALSQARYFVLLASPEAAASHWVDQEVRWWRENRSHDSVLIAVTDGELNWDNDGGDFDAGSPIPPGLRDWFPHEPLWVDLRWARGETDVSMRNPDFRNSVAELAAPMRSVPKDDLIGEDISQHRRTLRLARGAVALLALLLAFAVVGAIVAVIQRNEANDQKRLAQSQALVAGAREALGANPMLSARLAVEAVQTEQTPEAEGMLRRAAAAIPHRTLLAGHGGSVNTAAFSPDGELVVTASGDGTARIWDPESGAALATLPGHEDSVNSAAFSPDGERVVTASGDGTARIWDAESGAPLVTLRGHGPSRGVSGSKVVNSAAFSPDGERIVTAGADGTARVWAAESGAPLETFRGHQSIFPVNSAAFSPDAEQVVTAGVDGTARIWDPDDGAELVKLGLFGHDEIMYSAAFSPDGERVVTADDDRRARVWDAEGGPPLATMVHGRRGVVNSAAFSPDGELVVTASDDATARIWEAESGAPLEALRGHGDLVNSAGFSPDGKRIVTAGFDGTARIWDADPGAPLGTLRGHRSPVDSAAFSSDGELIITASRSARIWDAESGALLKTLHHPGPLDLTAAFSPDGERVVTRGYDRTARIWDAESGALLTKVDHGHTVSSVEFSPDGERVVTASHGLDELQVLDVASDENQNKENKARIWDAESGAPLATLRGHRGGFNSATFSPDGERVVTAGDEGNATIWDAESGAPLATWLAEAGALGNISSAAFSPDGERVLTVDSDGTARIWEAESGAPLVKLGHGGALYSVEFSPDGERVVAASSDQNQKARIWDAESGAPLATLRGHRGGINAVAFTPDGERVVTAGNDGTARIWDAASGALLETFRGHGYSRRPHHPVARSRGLTAVNSAAFSPDGQLVVTASHRTAQIWTCGLACKPLSALLKLAPRLAGNLSPAERARYLPA